MNLIVLKKMFSKMLLWLKHNWYVPLSLLFIGVSYVLFREKANSLMEAFMENRQGYKEQVKKIDEIHEKQISERNEHINVANKEIKELEKNHNDNVERIENKKAALVQDLKNKDLASELDKEFDL